MHIIIKHIPKVLVIDELDTHLRSLLKGQLFRKPGELKALRMLNLIDSSNKLVEGHALAWVDSTTSKQRLIKAINAGSFQDAFLNIDDEICNFDRIKASEFTIRHFNNDRRIKTDVTQHHAQNQRSRDRRRNLNTIVFAQKTYNISHSHQPQRSPEVRTQIAADSNSLRSWAWNGDLQRFT